MPKPLAQDPDDAVVDLHRAHTYRLLAALLAGPPDGDALALLGRIDSLETPAAPLARAWWELKRAAARTTPDSVDDEYHRLFVGLGRGEVVPYGSWYLAGTILGKPLVALRADLAALGIVRQDGVTEPEDHAAALCETMALLASSSNGDIRTQGRFFSNHVASWMGRLFRDMADARAATFYRCVGGLGAAFLAVEETYLAATAEDGPPAR